MKERIAWIDNLKTISIFLVVFSHSTREPLNLAINSFIMSLFFMISGYLYHPVELKCELKKCFSSLIKPYVFYIVILYCIYLITHKDDNQVDTIINIVLANHVYFVKVWAPLCPLWFIPALLFMRIIMSVFFVLRNKLIYQIILAVFVTVAIIIASFHSWDKIDYYMLGSSIMCIPFFFLGFWLQKTRAIPFEIKYGTFIWIVILSFAIWVSYINGRIDIIKCNFGHNITLFYFDSIVVSLSFLYLSMRYLNIGNKVIRHLSDGTFLIMAIHYVMIKPIRYLCGVNSYGIFESIIIMGICYCLILISKRYFPLLIGNKK